MSADDPQAQAQLAMLQGSKMAMFFNPEFSRLEFNFGMVMNTTTIINVKKSTGLMLMTGMLGKKAVKLTETDIKTDKTEAKTEDIVITGTDEVKDILGYSCKKYNVAVGEGVEISYWTTTEIDAPKNKNKFMLQEVEGFPLQFETSTMGMKMVFTASDFKNSLKGIDTKKMFDTSIPDGYEITDMDQMKKMGM